MNTILENLENVNMNIDLPQYEKNARMYAYIHELTGFLAKNNNYETYSKLATSKFRIPHTEVINVLLRMDDFIESEKYFFLITLLAQKYGKRISHNTIQCRTDILTIVNQNRLNDPYLGFLTKGFLTHFRFSAEFQNYCFQVLEILCCTLLQRDKVNADLVARTIACFVQIIRNNYCDAEDLFEKVSDIVDHYAMTNCPLKFLCELADQLEKESDYYPCLDEFASDLSYNQLRDFIYYLNDHDYYNIIVSCAQSYYTLLDEYSGNLEPLQEKFYNGPYLKDLFVRSEYKQKILSDLLNSLCTLTEKKVDLIPFADFEHVQKQEEQTL